MDGPLNPAAGFRHALWCDQHGDEGHTSCGALLGTVVVDGTRLDIRLTRAPDEPTVVLLTVHGDRVVALNIERVHELETVFRHALDLMAGQPNG